MRAAIYCRVSTTMQEDNYSLPTQEEACRKHAASLGYEVAGLYQDIHSGYELWERPQLTALREAARAGDFAAIIVYDPDRLSRRQVHYAVLVDECERHGIELLFVQGQHDKTAVGEFLANARAFAAELEREKFRERSQRGMIARAKNGNLRPSNRPLYGYRWANEKKGAYVIDEERAAVVRRLFNAAANGETLRGLAAMLRREGVPTANGAAEWNFAVIRGMLRHEGYMGVAVVNAYASVKAGGKRKRVRRAAEEHIPLPDGTIPPIVSPELFAAVQVKLDRNKSEAVRNNRDEESFLLRAGFIVCGYCGKRIHTAWFRGRKGAPLRPSYTVLTSSCDHRDCPAFSISAHIIDGVVWQKVAAIITQPEIIAAELARLCENDPTEADVTAIERALGDLERRQRNLGRSLALIDDADTAVPLVAELTTIATRKRELEAERQSIEARRATWRASQDRIADLQSWVRTVAANVDELGYKERRDLLMALDVKVKLYRADHSPRYEITASIPLDNPPIVLAPSMSSCPSRSSTACGRRMILSCARPSRHGTPTPRRAATASPAR